jgi:hypothetical protein
MHAVNKENKKMLFGNPEGYKLLWKPRRRRKDNITVDLNIEQDVRLTGFF